MKKKKKYLKPKVEMLVGSDVVTGAIACETGNGPLGHCKTGTGGSPSGCGSGSLPGNICFPGSSAIGSCSTGNNIAIMCGGGSSDAG